MQSPRNKYLILIAVLIGVLGLSIACRRPASNGPQSLRLLSICQLNADPKPHLLKEIKVKATLGGYHTIVLSDPACEGAFVRADLDVATRQDLIKKLAALGDSGVKHGNFEASVVLTGRFEELTPTEKQEQHPGELPSGRKEIIFAYRMAVRSIDVVQPISTNRESSPVCSDKLDQFIYAELLTSVVYNENAPGAAGAFDGFNRQPRWWFVANRSQPNDWPRFAMIPDFRLVRVNVCWIANPHFGTYPVGSM